MSNFFFFTLSYFFLIFCNYLYNDKMFLSMLPPHTQIFIHTHTHIFTLSHSPFKNPNRVMLPIVCPWKTWEPGQICLHRREPLFWEQNRPGWRSGREGTSLLKQQEHLAAPSGSPHWSRSPTGVRPHPCSKPSTRFALHDGSPPAPSTALIWPWHFFTIRNSSPLNRSWTSKPGTSDIV